jgi:hypothetical protein
MSSVVQLLIGVAAVVLCLAGLSHSEGIAREIKTLRKQGRGFLPGSQEYRPGDGRGISGALAIGVLIGGLFIAQAATRLLG